ncbi:MAG: S1 family peptidase, partial [Actinomycetota bacterium]|nr:S1 family peptidase [Actinomycetota bacterium]
GVRSPLATDALAAALWGDEPPPSCKNGATNHASCQEVRSLNECRSAYCNLVEMGARLAAGGDSGGPIYWGNTAYGLHEGWKYDPAPPFDRDLFSRADRIDNALDVWIDTN